MTQDIAGGRRGVAKRPLAARAVGLVVNAPLLAILDELPLPVVALVGESLPVGTRARLANQIRHLFVVQLGPGDVSRRRRWLFQRAARNLLVAAGPIIATAPVSPEAILLGARRQQEDANSALAALGDGFLLAQQESRRLDLGKAAVHEPLGHLLARLLLDGRFDLVVGDDLRCFHQQRIEVGGLIQDVRRDFAFQASAAAFDLGLQIGFGRRGWVGKPAEKGLDFVELVPFAAGGVRSVQLFPPAAVFGALSQRLQFVDQVWIAGLRQGLARHTLQASLIAALVEIAL